MVTWMDGRTSRATPFVAGVLSRVLVGDVIHRDRVLRSTPCRRRCYAPRREPAIERVAAAPPGPAAGTPPRLGVPRTAHAGHLNGYLPPSAGRPRRRGKAGDSASLRDLVDYFNREVLRSALTDAGEQPLEGELGNVYRLLTDGEVATGTKIRARKRLEREGVDFDAVEQRFVSHRTIGRHLEECLGVEKSEPSRDRLETAKSRIFKMQN